MEQNINNYASHVEERNIIFGIKIKFLIFTPVLLIVQPGLREPTNSVK